MRTLVRGNSISECEKAVNRKKKDGWTAITDVKVDDSLAYISGDVSYVVVMELPDDPNALKKRRRWNNQLPNM